MFYWFIQVRKRIVSEVPTPYNLADSLLGIVLKFSIVVESTFDSMFGYLLIVLVATTPVLLARVSANLSQSKKSTISRL